MELLSDIVCSHPSLMGFRPLLRSSQVTWGERFLHHWEHGVRNINICLCVSLEPIYGVSQVYVCARCRSPLYHSRSTPVLPRVCV
jgi:hypothetical protein